MKNTAASIVQPRITAAEIKTAFLMAFNMLLENRGEILEAYKEVIEALTNISDLGAGQGQLQSEIEIVVEMIRKLIGENTQVAMEQLNR